MSVRWLVVAVCACALATADRGGASLRGALEALQRRQRARSPGPDYDTLYEFIPPQPYPDTDYGIEVDALEEDPPPQYIIKLLDNKIITPENYKYKMVNKKKSNYMPQSDTVKKESAFRERNHLTDNDRLRDLFMDKNENEDKKENQERAENDAEYAMLLGQLWSKYKGNNHHQQETPPQGVVKLYKDKYVKKRSPDNWGPIAFKKKRSPDSQFESNEPQPEEKFDDDVLNTYGAPDDRGDMRDEYSIAFQPLDDDTASDSPNKFSYDLLQKRFPVSKRSSAFEYSKNYHKKRFAHEHKKQNFRSSAGTDPKIIKELSEIFGESNTDIIKTPVKRSEISDESSHESKPPQITIMQHNSTHEHENPAEEVESHELHGHNIHHPGISGKEIEIEHPQEEKPIMMSKKSIDWSDYFGIDKRQMNQDKLRRKYFETLNKEVINPRGSFQQHSKVKRNFVQSQMKNEPQTKSDVLENNAPEATKESKLDNIEKRLKHMEDVIVDEALHFSNSGEELDSKEEQELKEKELSRLAAAYSLKKMRKALDDFKHSLHIQKNMDVKPSAEPEDRSADVAEKKSIIETNEIRSRGKDEPFEGEQGAGHYINGGIDEQFSEGYMGGSGRHHDPIITSVSGEGSCPLLSKIMQRCRGVDVLAGDRSQLFVPLCSLHQICYLCGESPQTTCDLLFLSEADTACEGETDCQRSARSTLMALRELHDAIADELDGVCEANPCLPATLQFNNAWQRALKR